MSEYILAVIQPLFLLAVAPFFSGTTRVLRAKIHGRKGPSILQDYYDLFKLFKRQDVKTKDSGLPFRLMPILFLGSMIVLAMGMPLVTRFSPIPFLADFIFILYLLVLPRFFFALSAIDSAGAYPTVGGIRELIVGSLVEPAMIIALITMAVVTGATNIGMMGEIVSFMSFDSPVAVVVAGCAFLAACYVELGKLPFDLAEAEQEIQEGPLAEYSGPSLAMVKLAMSMKQILVMSVFIAVFLPFGSAVEMTAGSLLVGLVVYAVKMAVIFLVCALIENTVVRAHFKLMPNSMWLITGFSALSFVFLIMGV